MEPSGVQWLRPGLRKCEYVFNLIHERKETHSTIFDQQPTVTSLIHMYIYTSTYIVFFPPPDSCELTLDTNTVNRRITLSDNNRKVTHVEEDQSYPDHPERFDQWPQVLSRNYLTGRCYWEVEWRGLVYISVTYRGISRRGNSDNCWFGRNDQSWSLTCSNGRYSVWHNNKGTSITSSPPPSFFSSLSSSFTSSSTSSSSVSNRVAVYVDCPAGTLSFYRVYSDTLIHLHTFNTTFTEALYPGFGFRFGAWSDSSVSLVSVGGGASSC